MNRFGFSDSVLDSVKAVLRGEKPEVEAVEEVEEKSEDLLEAMEMHLKPHGTAGTHYKVHAVGKKLAAHGGIKVGERLSDTEVDDARESGIRVRHMKEDTEEEVEEGAMKRMATQAAERDRLGPTKVKGSGLEGFKKRDPRIGSTKFGGTKSFAQTGRVPMVPEAADLDDANVDKALKHDCASHVVHKEHGEGTCIPGMHTIVETEEGEGYVTHYDVMFGTQIIEDVPVEELEIVKEMSHGHSRKKKMSEAHQGKKHLDPVDQKALKGTHAQRKDKDIDNDGDVDSSDSYLHNRRKTVKKAINKEAHEMMVKKMGKDAMGAEKVDMSKGCPTVSEGMGDEKVRSSAQAAQLAKHYYMKAKQAQTSGSKETAGKMMSAAKKFYRASEKDSAQEKGGKQVAAAESSEDVGVGQFYFNELEVQEIEAAEDVNLDEAVKGGGAKVGETERSGLRVSKTSKEGPEHVVMQLRKVGSMGNRHPGVEFKDGKKAKVDVGHARAALSKYNSAKPAEREEMQRHLSHSHDALKHVAKGGDLKSSPGASKSKGIGGVDVTQMKRHGVQSKSGHYN